VSALLFLPWFRAEAWHIPLPGGHSLPIQPFGLLVATGVMLGYKLGERRAKQVGLDPLVYADLVAHILVGGFVAGHVLDAIAYHPAQVAQDIREITDGTFWKDAEDGIRFPYTLKLWAGLSSYGGFTGAALGSIVWKIRRRVPLIAVNDVVIWALPFGWLFGRMGCFVVHDHPGIVTDFPLAIADYQVGNPPFQPRHDLGLYEVFWCLSVIPFLWWLQYKKLPRGFFLGFVPTVYAPIRFGLDFLRARPEELGDHADPRYFGLTPGHYASLTVLAIGLAFFWRIYRGAPIELPEYARWTPEKEAARAAAEAAEDAAHEAKRRDDRAKKKPRR
jgi:phosphatidylglycerol:prolipoprotein diacylglycerol transferase